MLDWYRIVLKEPSDKKPLKVARLRYTVIPTALLESFATPTSIVLGDYIHT